jgi:ubiquinone/menaquinone biosynthesis C-methylase UbiE
VSYLSLACRVPEASVMEPEAVTWAYALITHVPLVRTAHRRFVVGSLAQGVVEGWALDLGTGPGYVARRIARRRPGLSLVGLDLAARMVQRARRAATQAGLDGRGIWPQGDGHRLPFAEGSFDLVVSSFSLHHWTEPLRVLDEIARVLRPGGRYYIADLCREVTLLQRLFAYASIPALSPLFGSYWGYGGYYESIRAGYTLDEARALLARSALPPGVVALDSTWLVPILTLSSKGEG